MRKTRLFTTTMGTVSSERRPSRFTEGAWVGHITQALPLATLAAVGAVGAQLAARVLRALAAVVTVAVTSPGWHADTGLLADARNLPWAQGRHRRVRGREWRQRWRWSAAVAADAIAPPAGELRARVGLLDPVRASVAEAGLFAWRQRRRREGRRWRGWRQRRRRRRWGRDHVHLDRRDRIDRLDSDAERSRCCVFVQRTQFVDRG